MNGVTQTTSIFMSEMVTSRRITERVSPRHPFGGGGALFLFQNQADNVYILKN